MKLMRAFILMTLAALAVVACGSSDSAAPILYPDIYVNPVLGDDGWEGSYVLPYRSITHAMTKAASGDVVKAEPGTYAEDETFPIRIANGVMLVGDEALKGATPIPTVIEGMGSFNASGDQAAVVMGEGSAMAGMIVRTNDLLDANSGALYINSTGVTVRNNTLTSSYWGLFSDNGPDTVKVQGNIIKGNTNGVDLRHEGMDLGGGTAGSTGGNQIRCSTYNDVYFNLSIGNSASAESNYWDHSPPTEGLLATDDIYNKYSHVLDTSGYALSPLACP